jgi:hypothetical protein
MTHRAAFRPSHSHSAGTPRTCESCRIRGHACLFGSGTAGQTKKDDAPQRNGGMGVDGDLSNFSQTTLCSPLRSRVVTAGQAMHSMGRQVSVPAPLALSTVHGEDTPYLQWHRSCLSSREVPKWRRS